MCFLVGTLPNGEFFKHELGHDRSTVGRLDLSTIRIEEDSISALHAELIPYGERRFLLRDLRSTNGTIVDGQRISEAEIKAPCTLAFGRLDCELQPCDSPECPLHGSGPSLGLKAEDRDQSARVLREILLPETPKTAGEDTFEQDLAECRSWAATEGVDLPWETASAQPASIPASPEPVSEASQNRQPDRPLNEPSETVPLLSGAIGTLNPAGAPRIEIVLPKPPKPKSARKGTPLKDGATTCEVPSKSQIDPASPTVPLESDGSGSE